MGKKEVIELVFALAAEETVIECTVAPQFLAASVKCTEDHEILPFFHRHSTYIRFTTVLMIFI